MTTDPPSSEDNPKMQFHPKQLRLVQFTGQGNMLKSHLFQMKGISEVDSLVKEARRCDKSCCRALKVDSLDTAMKVTQLTGADDHFLVHVATRAPRGGGSSTSLKSTDPMSSVSAPGSPDLVHDDSLPSGPLGVSEHHLSIDTSLTSVSSSIARTETETPDPELESGGLGGEGDLEDESEKQESPFPRAHFQATRNSKRYVHVFLFWKKMLGLEFPVTDTLLQRNVWKNLKSCNHGLKGENGHSKRGPGEGVCVNPLHYSPKLYSPLLRALIDQLIALRISENPHIKHVLLELGFPRLSGFIPEHQARRSFDEIVRILNGPVVLQLPDYSRQESLSSGGPERRTSYSMRTSVDRGSPFVEPPSLDSALESNVSLSSSLNQHQNDQRLHTQLRNNLQFQQHNSRILSDSSQLPASMPSFPSPYQFAQPQTVSLLYPSYVNYPPQLVQSPFPSSFPQGYHLQFPGSSPLVPQANLVPLLVTPQSGGFMPPNLVASPLTHPNNIYQSLYSSSLYSPLLTPSGQLTPIVLNPLGPGLTPISPHLSTSTPNPFVVSLSPTTSQEALAVFTPNLTGYNQAPDAANTEAGPSN